MGDLTKNFSRYEFECPHCGKNDISKLLVSQLQMLRDKFKKPIIVTSGVRCEEHNRDVGGVLDSKHLTGEAADIVIRDVAPEEIAREAVKIPDFRRGGIGVYNTFIHLDVRSDGPARWGKRWRNNGKN